MDKKLVNFRLDPDTIKKVKILAIEQDTNLTELLTEAVHDLLKKYGKDKDA